ncbi:MAG: hypothetical protein MUP26_09070, partial [Desulfobulbaceae bacterium]|nr:hypothetical protein [Desulfobulbaceae bacterium]
LDFPEREEELLILKSNLPFADDDILDYVVDFLQAAHNADERYSVRDGINIARYALKRLSAFENGKNDQNRKPEATLFLKEAASMILDSSASDYLSELIDGSDR